MERGRFSILIVDDEKSNLDVLDHILQPLYAVHVAKSGAAALKRVAADRPDLILLDVVMPDMSGFEVLDRLKTSPETRDIPVILATGLDSAEDERKGFLLGAADYIGKPFRQALVAARVRNHLEIVRLSRLVRSLGHTDSLADSLSGFGCGACVPPPWGGGAVPDAGTAFGLTRNRMGDGASAP